MLLWRTADPSAPLLRHPVPASSTSELALDLEGGAIRFTEGDNLVSAVRTVALTGTERGGRQGESPFSPFSSARFNQDGTRLVTTHPATIELRDGTTGGLRDTFAVPPACTGCSPVPLTAFSRDGRTLAYLSAPDTLTLRTFDPHPTVTSLPSRTGVDGVAIGSRDSAVVTRTSYGVDFLALGESRATLPRKRYGTLLDRASDGRIITDERQLIDPAEGRTASVVRVMPGEGPAAAAVFSPNGRHLAMSDYDGRVTLWDGDGRTRLAVLTPGADTGTGGERRPSVPVFSADGGLLAVGDADGELRFWSTDSPRSAGSPLPSADGPVLALAFASDGSRLRATTPHTPVRTYPLGLERTAGAVCARAGGGLTREGWGSYLPTVPYRETC